MGQQNVLIIGGGGREHALAWKLAQSSRVGKIYVASGNGGTKQIAENIPISANDVGGLSWFAEKKKIDLTVVGPDDPLALGVVDAFRTRGLRIFGPTCAAAEIEFSKAFAKNLINAIGIPTAEFEIFNEYDKARAYVRECKMPIVIKASGLALGKGAYICKTKAKAENALAEIMLARVHREAGREVIVEKFLDGQEISIHAFCDGKTEILLPTCQDHKRVFDGDQGRNTGGMGTIAPVPWTTAETLREAREKIVRPILKALAERERTFTGLLYPGLINNGGGLKVLEYNARFGDPETQSYMRLLKTDLLDILETCVDGTLAECAIEWNPGFAVCVVLTSGGYPGKYAEGIPIRGLNEAEKIPGVIVFHAGTTRLRTSGGRVLGVSAVGDTLRGALDRAYEAARLIHFKGMHYRRDIGAKALASL